MEASPPPKSPWIVEGARDTFSSEVFQRSQDTLVVVDFWAAWCQPCRLLGPVLEQLAAQYEGRFVLVKADTERLPEAAAQFGVQAIPAVFAVLGGEVVDFFQGLLPPEQVRAWLDRILADAALRKAQQLEDEDPQAAEGQYRQMLQRAPRDAPALIGLARVLLASGRERESREILGQLQQRGYLEPEAEKLKSALQLRGRKADDVAVRRAAAEQEPESLPRRLELAQALAGDQQYEEALEICLALVQKDRHGAGEKARQLMIDIFRVLPDGSELAGAYRRKLATTLY